MELNIVRPFHPNLTAIAEDLAACLGLGMDTNNPARDLAGEATVSALLEGL